MRVLFYTTGTRDCEKLWGSFLSLGHETEVVRYDVRDFDMAAYAETRKPDVIIYIGAIGDFHFGLPVPTTEVLARTGRVAPMVHLCSDAADPPWWPLLEEYNEVGVFKLQVTIDGVMDSPIGRFGKVALTPIDPTYFNNLVPYNERPYVCGFAGGGGCRVPIIAGIRHVGATLHWLKEGAEVPYQEMCDFYKNCKIVLNYAWTGSGARRHVKGRAIEAGLAGAVLLEPYDSPLRIWFEPGVDFVEWTNVEDASAAIKNGGVNEAMADRFKAKMLANHTAQIFWADVFKRIGL